MKKKRFLLLLLVLVLTCSFVVSCGKKDNETDGKQDVDVDDSKKDDEEVAEDQGPVVFRITGGKTATLNPHIYKTSAEAGTMSYIFGNLLDMIYDKDIDNYKLIPNHAVDLPTKNEEGTVWTFKLKEDLKWEDGSPLNARDYEYSYKMLLDPKLKNSRGPQVFDSDIVVVNAKKYWDGECEWEDVGIKALDDYTLEITLEFPVPEMDLYLAFTGGGASSPVQEKIYEAGMNEERTETDYGTSKETTPSCGVYKLEEWVRDQIKVYVKNEYSPIKDVYTVDRIESRVVEDENTNVQLFENGDIDVTGLSGPNYDKYAEDPRLVFAKSTTVWSMFINMTSEEKPFLQDVNFRKALFYAMDRKTIAEDIFKTAIPAPYVVSSAKVAVPSKGLTYRETDVAKSVLPENDGYDLDLAKEYFDKAYEAYGKKMEVEVQYFDNSEQMKRVAELLEQDYENAFGPDRIDIQLRAVPWNNAYDNMESGKYDLGFGGWAGGIFNPWSSMEVYTSGFTSKIDQFKSEEFDKLYERTVKGDLIFKEQERLEALAEMEKMLLDVVPFVPMYEPVSAVMYADRVHLITEGKWIPGVGFGVLQSHFDPLE
ncbi:oligopeptide transport system substrate-binding protein [Keratinibaculum paraultunense]|uniref:Oligopeptide transport system substrate-binding protein n=1 Tax=Keratinibaculum paraultunense TaxID=1278232 RepID=A0A4R3KTU8_9FIRM|nr:peptide ABC transporter substrate-binding protein [Keratinibaculum paraultunense]TCS88767.1 oligopeptide transport system substrate-binding protein [Keratinibaculum paraultunense]